MSYELNTAIAQPYLIGIGSAAVVAAIAILTLIDLGFTNVQAALENIGGALTGAWVQELLR